MARKKQFNTRYSPEFKISVILDMRENGLGYNETARKYWGYLHTMKQTSIVRSLDYGNEYILKKEKPVSTSKDEDEQQRWKIQRKEDRERNLCLKK